MRENGGAKGGGKQGSKRGAKPKKGGGLTTRDRLEEDLRAAIGRVDEEGLVFLLEQANVLIHNARVEELRRKRSDGNGEDGPGDLDPEHAEARARAAVAVEEAPDRKAYFITLGKVRKVLSVAEMQGLVRICRASESTADGARRLYNVFARERRDILIDAGIGSAASKQLALLHEAVLARFPPPATT